MPQPPGETLWHAPHLLLQKFSAPAFTATTRVSFSPATESDRAGLIVFGFDYAWVGLQRRGDGLDLVLIRCPAADDGGREEQMFSAPFAGDSVQLRVTVQEGADCAFAWSADGTNFAAIPVSFRARSSAWVGAKVGLFASGGTATAARRGHADFDWFRVTPP
jgi:beta-xylosidase